MRVKGEGVYHVGDGIAHLLDVGPIHEGEGLGLHYGGYLVKGLTGRASSSTPTILHKYTLYNKMCKKTVTKRHHP